MQSDQTTHRRRDGWLFDQPPSCAVFTTSHVLKDGQPITHVFHDLEDHGWQFHYSGEKSAADAMIVGLGEIVEMDGSILEVSDLPPGWMAVREGTGRPWKRCQHQTVEEADET